jgi:hypothetical protein
LAIISDSNSSRFSTLDSLERPKSESDFQKDEIHPKHSVALTGIRPLPEPSPERVSLSIRKKLPKRVEKGRGGIRSRGWLFLKFVLNKIVSCELPYQIGLAPFLQIILWPF